VHDGGAITVHAGSQAGCADYSYMLLTAPKTRSRWQSRPRGLVVACVRATGRVVTRSTRWRWSLSGSALGLRERNPTTATRSSLPPHPVQLTVTSARHLEEASR
jgi:hypothetical protein